MAAFLTVSTSLYQDRDGAHATSRRITSSALMAVRLFVDHDGKRRFSEGDEPLPDIRIQNVGMTDATGIAQRWTPAFVSVVLHVLEADLLDPRWVVPDQLRVVPRPGVTGIIAMPVEFRPIFPS